MAKRKQRKPAQAGTTRNTVLYVHASDPREDPTKQLVSAAALPITSREHTALSRPVNKHKS